MNSSNNRENAWQPSPDNIPSAETLEARMQESPIAPDTTAERTAEDVAVERYEAVQNMISAKKKRRAEEKEQKTTLATLTGRRALARAVAAGMLFVTPAQAQGDTADVVIAKMQKELRMNAFEQLQKDLKQDHAAASRGAHTMAELHRKITKHTWRMMGDMHAASEEELDALYDAQQEYLAKNYPALRQNTDSVSARVGFDDAHASVGIRVSGTFEDIGKAPEAIAHAVQQWKDHPVQSFATNILNIAISPLTKEVAETIDRHTEDTSPLADDRH